jgi:phenylacetic acid degradation operon negative regulatory protein
MGLIQPRAALLTLYGDYGLQIPRGEIGIGSLIELLSNFGLSEQAIRSAVSRMCRNGILKVRRMNTKSYYSLTEEGSGLLETGKQRIFDRKKRHWNDRWTIVTYSIPEQQRTVRNQLRQELGWLGFGPLSKATWISPNNLIEQVEEIANRLHIKDHIQIFETQHRGSTDPQNIVNRCWDLKRLHKKYSDFIVKYQPKLDDYQRRIDSNSSINPSTCFVERFELIHEYRRFPFFDPDLPVELLPKDWLRFEATDLFHKYYGLLTNRAGEYFDSVYKSY